MESIIISIAARSHMEQLITWESATDIILQHLEYYEDNTIVRTTAVSCTRLVKLLPLLKKLQLKYFLTDNR